MRLGQFESETTDGTWGGLIDGEEVVHLHAAADAAGIALPRDLRSITAEWEWREKVELAATYARETGVGLYDPADLTRREPITDPQKVICVGLNYRDHADEGGFDAPDEPVLFSKFPQSLIGPDETIEWDPALTSEVDYEGELVVVMGDRARNVDESEALEYVAGYTIGNDVSARDLQMADEQWVRGKSLDTFGPIGPHVVTPEEVDDSGDLDIWTEVNGERLQESNTRQLIFDLAELVAFCSRAFTLEPGDLIYTGTPDGVGYFRDPRVLLDDGDAVTVGIEGIGELHNTCRHA
ncbi:fumarylacetoacetate hydrolase family protein [Halalkalicoccus sp. NIPERK01]|uniref:fumarylacetoacetate hydrolase family protein n=1 Tax=Halalkalicoccus sp. NIPERK01 TaxID=3053469 RepID=UPI00256E9BDA|nr:fumarylacetoacetate hydrolase family protein [Halalkalicoccus sp. NIPERK01]MDL5363333.1 fumarylacetoacetate hydrolase family protein [Halalkalicoccus sp. NIPERK01]